MARIVYKKGLEGQNTLKSIEGIEIDMLNGQKALIYPKYSEEVMLPDEKIEFWEAKKVRQIEALKETETRHETDQLYALGSPAALWVANFRSDAHGTFTLPSLLAALELQHQKNEIDALAKTIEGADLLRDHPSGVWSCSRCGEDGGWVAYGDGGFAVNYNLCSSNLAVPLVLYR